MRQITFDDDLKDYLRNLRERLGPPISHERMDHILGSDGCGAVCKVTCSMWCSPIGSGQTIDVGHTPPD